MGSAAYDYRCRIVEWRDGDTATIDVDLGFYLTFREVVRVYGINAPETHTRDKAEKERGLAAKLFACSLAPPGSDVLIRSMKPERPTEKFGRWLAVVTLPDGRDLGSMMIAAGHANPYFGGKRE